MDNFVGNVFGWFFRIVNYIYHVLNYDLVISFAGFSISMWQIIITLLIINIFISCFIHPGGGKVD